MCTRAHDMLRTFTSTQATNNSKEAGLSMLGHQSMNLPRNRWMWKMCWGSRDNSPWSCIIHVSDVSNLTISFSLMVNAHNPFSWSIPITFTLSWFAQARTHLCKWGTVQVYGIVWLLKGAETRSGYWILVGIHRHGVFLFWWTQFALIPSSFSSLSIQHTSSCIS